MARRSKDESVTKPKRGRPPKQQETDRAARLAAVPHTPKQKHVVILGLGPSSERYFYLSRCMGSRHAFADECWAVNAYGDIAQCDMILHMDDFRIQEIRAKARPESNIAQMVKSLQATRVPILTCRKYPEYPTAIEFPLEEAMNTLEFAYFNNTVPYGVAYALLKGFTKISLYGCDYTYANSHDAEKGRACLEFWLSKALQMGVEVNIPAESSLLDSNVPDDRRLYGFSDTRTVTIATPGGGARATVRFQDRFALPTADEIENRYDHAGKV